MSTERERAREEQSVDSAEEGAVDVDRGGTAVLPKDQLDAGSAKVSVDTKLGADRSA